ncbi:hypothetical protein FSP39_014205 [Pinctada imbricata]|uniref:E2F-associated phosphoprotein n=1 Tax=Pinctada imbricata TaxID=66713 RepID=A0AA88XWJ4_PINIB|nr:hypothetical protein FSP39_014205 [Pinctada imbricata]
MYFDKFKHYDYLEEEDDSDQGATDSSEDDIDIILHGRHNQKRRLSRSTSGAESSESDFEKEMRQELDEKVEALEKARRSPGQSSSGIGHSTQPDTDVSQGPSRKQKYYDDVYFDSDEEEMVTSAGDERKRRKKGKHKVLTDDNLLYDPDMDDEDQKWVDKHRRSYQPKGQGNKPSKLPKSDAVLDCPACMTTLCLDCQKHDVYHNQYRAMFVMNCEVDRTEQLKYPEPAEKKRRKKGKGKQVKITEDTGTSFSNGTVDNQQAMTSCASNDIVKDDVTSCGSNDIVHDNMTSSGCNGMVNDDMNVSELSDQKLHPVRCNECNTVVAVMDHDEVYHFFNVLASH